MSTDAAAQQQQILPVTGEYLQSLCEVTLMYREHYESIKVHVETGDSRDRVRFVDDGFPAELLATTRSLFLYPIPEAVEPTFEATWPALRLVIVQSGDNTVPAELVASFLRRHPACEVWQVNQVAREADVAARHRPLPLFEQGRYWRTGGSSVDAPIAWGREGDEGRNGSIFCTWRWDTNQTRRDLFYEVAELVGKTATPLALYRYLEKEDYEEALRVSTAVLAPPGNGVDTHRCWEALYKGAWPIVFANAHTKLLLEEYPDLPLLTIEAAEDLRELVVPPCPSPFHACLGREYWKEKVERRVRAL